MTDLPYDILRYIIIKYIDNNNVNKKKLQMMGSHRINDMLTDIVLEVPQIYELCKNVSMIIKGRINYEGSNYVDCDGYTSLMYACKNRKTKIALKLVTLKCVPEQVNKYGDTALIWACKKKYVGCCSQVIRNGL